MRWSLPGEGRDSRVETFLGGGGAYRGLELGSTTPRLVLTIHLLINDVFSIHWVSDKGPEHGATALSNGWEDHYGSLGWWKETSGSRARAAGCGISGWVWCTWPVDTAMAWVRQIRCHHISHREKAFWTLQCGSIVMPACGLLTDHLWLEMSIPARGEYGFLPLFLPLLKKEPE